MRLEYYNKYKAKGYDVSSLDAYLDGPRLQNLSSGKHSNKFRIITKYQTVVHT